MKNLLVLMVLLLTDATSVSANGCPLCPAASQTLSEEMATMDAAVVVELVEPPPPAKADGGDDNELPKAKFKVVRVVKGETVVKLNQLIESVYLGTAKRGSSFLMMAVDPNNLMWTTPVKLSDRGRNYISKLLEIPKEGSKRLEFFQDYIEDSDEVLAQDAYDEFAKAPYATVQDLKPKMHHDKLVKLIENPGIHANRRRLCLMMLGVCGGSQDVPMLEAMLKSSDQKAKESLDAMIACYLSVKGPEGMSLIEDLYLKNSTAENSDTNAAIRAIRFHVSDAKVIPQERLMKGLRHILDRPQLADLVILDLARAEDWDVMDKLVQLFKTADVKNSWVRVPVVNYLQACPLPQAKKYIEELEKIDPAAVKRANTFLPPDGTAKAAPKN